MSVEGGKETLLQNDLIQKKSECRMFLWPAFDTIKTLRYMQGREGVASLFLEEETCNEVAVNLRLGLFTLLLISSRGFLRYKM